MAFLNIHCYIYAQALMCDLDKPTQKDNTMVYPGHGHFSTILNEKYENPFIKQLI